jgi:hypothetical protein
MPLAVLMLPNHARSHDALDEDQVFQSEIDNAAILLTRKIIELRSTGGVRAIDEGLHDPRPK